MNKNIIVNKLNKAATISNPNRTASVAAKLMTASVALNNVNINGTIFESNLEFRKLTKNFEELVTVVEYFNAIIFSGALTTDENAVIDNVDSLVNKVTSDVLLTLEDFLRDIESVKIEEVTFQETLSKSMSKLLDESFIAIESISSIIDKITDDEEAFVFDDLAVIVAKAFNETITVTDVISKITPSIPSTEVATTSDLTEMELDKNVLEVANAVETFNINFLKPLYEELTTPEEVVITALGKVADYDEAIVVENFSRIVTYIRNYEDSNPLTDSLLFDINIKFIDSITISDTIISAVISSTISPEFFEAGVSIDEISYLLTKIFTETLTSTDSFYNIVDKGVIEISIASDNIESTSFGKNIVETINQSEVYSFVIDSKILDSMLINEVFTKTINTQIADSFLTNEVYSTLTNKILTDTSSIVETLGIEPFKILSDNFTLNDSGEFFQDNYIADYYAAPYIGTTTTF